MEGLQQALNQFISLVGRVGRRLRLGKSDAEVTCGFSFASVPADAAFAKADLLCTHYSSWMRQHSHRTLSVVVSCILVSLVLKPASPWEAIVMRALGCKERTEEHEGPDGMLVYTSYWRHPLADIIHILAQLWLGVTLFHFVNRDIWFSLLPAFETLSVLFSGCFTLFMWVLMDVSMFPESPGRIVSSTLSQVSKLPILVVVSTLDSVRMRTWLKAAVLSISAGYLLLEVFRVENGLMDVPRMHECVYGYNCDAIVALYTRGLWTCAIFVAKSATCYLFQHPFAVLRPRFEAVNNGWPCPGSKITIDDDATASTEKGVDEIEIDVGRGCVRTFTEDSQETSETPRWGAGWAPSPDAARKLSLPKHALLDGSRLPLATVASVATSAALAAVAHSSLKAELRGDDATLDVFAESVVTSVLAAVEAFPCLPPTCLAAAKGARSQDPSWTTAVAVAANAAAGVVRGREEYPTLVLSAEVRSRCESDSPLHCHSATAVCPEGVAISKLQLEADTPQAEEKQPEGEEEPRAYDPKLAGEQKVRQSDVGDASDASDPALAELRSLRRALEEAISVATLAEWEKGAAIEQLEARTKSLAKLENQFHKMEKERDALMLHIWKCEQAPELIHIPQPGVPRTPQLSSDSSFRRQVSSGGVREAAPRDRGEPEGNPAGRAGAEPASRARSEKQLPEP